MEGPRQNHHFPPYVVFITNINIPLVFTSISHTTLVDFNCLKPDIAFMMMLILIKKDITDLVDGTKV